VPDGRGDHRAEVRVVDAGQPLLDVRRQRRGGRDRLGLWPRGRGRRFDAAGAEADRAGADPSLGEASQDLGAEQRQLLRPNRRLHDDGQHAVAQRAWKRARGDALADHLRPGHPIDGQPRAPRHCLVRGREQRADELRLALGFAAARIASLRSIGCRPADHQLGIS